MNWNVHSTKNSSKVWKRKLKKLELRIDFTPLWDNFLPTFMGRINHVHCTSICQSPLYHTPNCSHIFRKKIKNQQVIYLAINLYPRRKFVFRLNLCKILKKSHLKMSKCVMIKPKNWEPYFCFLTFLYISNKFVFEFYFFFLKNFSVVCEVPKLNSFLK